MHYIGLSAPWTVADALRWRREHSPRVSDQDALLELQEVCSSGKVRMRGVRRDANPYWSDERKIAVRLQSQKEEWVPPAELAGAYFELDGSPYHGGNLNWTSSRAVAWWPIRFASDDLIVAWLEHLKTRPLAAGRPEASTSREIQREKSPEQAAGPPDEPVPTPTPDVGALPEQGANPADRQADAPPEARERRKRRAPKSAALIEWLEQQSEPTRQRSPTYLASQYCKNHPGVCSSRWAFKVFSKLKAQPRGR